MVEALGLPVADGPIGEQRGVASPARLQERVLTADVEEGLLLAGEACVRQVLGRRTRAHGDIRVGFTGPFAEHPVCIADRLRGVLRPVAAHEGMADRLAGLLQGRLAGPTLLQGGVDDLLEPVRLDEAPIGACRGRKSGRNV